MRAVGDDQGLYAAECTLVAVAALAWILFLLVRWLSNSRPGLGIGRAIAAAAGVRVTLAAVYASAAFLAPSAVPDEKGFVFNATTLSEKALGSEAWRPHRGDGLVQVLGLQLKLFESPGEFSLRVVQIAFAVSGLCLISAAAYDLAGGRAAQITAWLLAFEPTNAFFAGQIHREALLMLADGVVALGAARMWTRRDLTAILIMGSGLAFALWVRAYAAQFLLAGAVAVTFAAALRRTSAKPTRSPLFAVAAGVAVLAMIAWVIRSSDEIINQVTFREAAGAQSVGNLNLEPVKYSSLADVALDLPRRAVDLLLRPYPWQVANANQRLGVLGTAVAWAALLLLVALVATNFSSARLRAPPLMLVAIWVAIGYSLSSLNAGTGFRYRTHVVFFLVALIGVLAASNPIWVGQRHRQRAAKARA
jgi:hypothetical protein